jgi:hypothetical protein
VLHRVAPPQGMPVTATAATDAPAKAPEASGTFSTGRYEVAVLEATVRVPINDFRGALDAVGKIAADLSAMPGMSATIVESPLDLRTTAQIRGRHEGAEPETMEPLFVLRVIRDRRAET